MYKDINEKEEVLEGFCYESLAKGGGEIAVDITGLGCLEIRGSVNNCFIDYCDIPNLVKTLKIAYEYKTGEEI